VILSSNSTGKAPHPQPNLIDAIFQVPMLEKPRHHSQQDYFWVSLDYVNKLGVLATRFKIASTIVTLNKGHAESSLYLAFAQWALSLL